MTQVKRRPVFQSSEEEEKVKIDPPMKPAEEPDEDVDDLIGDDAPEPVVEEPKPVLEQKELAGWKLIGPEQQNGKQYLVSQDTKSEGICAYWRKTRQLSHFRWVAIGKWSNALTNYDLIPQPIYFKEVSK